MAINQEKIMGEAKRRKKLDKNYGVIYKINNQVELSMHIDKLFARLTQKWQSEVVEEKTEEKALKKLQGWINEELNSYKEADRTLLANSLITSYAAMGDIAFRKHLFETKDNKLGYLIFIRSLILVLEPWLDDYKKEAGAELVEEINGVLMREL